MATLLLPNSIYEAHIIIAGKDKGLVLVQFKGPKPEGHGFYALLASEPPKECNLKKLILTFSSMKNKYGNEIFVVSPDDELPDQIELN